MKRLSQSNLAVNLKATIGAMPVFQERAKIPMAKRVAQWLNTLAGTVIFVGSFFLPKYLGFPWQAAAVVAFFGGWMASKQLVLTFVKVVPQTIAAVVMALTGKTPPES